MHSKKLAAGAAFPTILATGPDGRQIDIAQPKEGTDWKLVVVYRGLHCPLCTQYLNRLEEFVATLAANRIDVIAVSADSKAQMDSHLEKLKISFPTACGLSVEQMQKLGLYISTPRSAKETDHLFPEPGLFVINEQGRVQVVELSNSPFARAELESLVSGLSWIRDPANNYPIRGTYLGSE